MVSGILPRLAHVRYLGLTDVSSGYHNLKRDEKSYLTTFACKYDRYRYARLPFGPVTAGAMFQRRIDELKNYQMYLA